MIRTITAALAAFALISFAAMADDAKPAETKKEEKAEKKAEKAEKKADKKAEKAEDKK
jgi:hypothetical protein